MSLNIRKKVPSSRFRNIKRKNCKLQPNETLFINLLFQGYVNKLMLKIEDYKTGQGIIENNMSTFLCNNNKNEKEEETPIEHVIFLTHF